MAQLYLRPLSDSSLVHSCSSGSSGYGLISEASADGDSTYIYQSISGTSNASSTSIFKCGGTLSAKFKISTVQLVINARTTKGKDKDSASLAWNLYFNGVEGTSGASNLTTSYANYGSTYSASSFGFGDTIWNSLDAIDFQVHIQTQGKKDSTKNDAFQNRATQAYLLLTYEEVTDPVYTCAAVAGEGIENTTVSAGSVISGNSCTFTATLKSNYNIFDGWYSDSECTNLVSTANPYTTTITADTTLYAKASRSSYTMTVGTAEHGTASVSATTALYGDSVTYTFTPEDETWELYGWYSDPDLTQLVSEANPYTFTAAADVTLYPKVGLKRFTITLQSPGAVYTQSATDLAIIAVKTELLTVDDMRSLRAGDFAAINSEKIIAQESKSSTTQADFSVSISTTIGSTVALYAQDTAWNGFNYGSYENVFTTYFLKNDVQISNGPHYVYQPTTAATYTTLKANATAKPWRCECTAIALDGVEYAEVYPKQVAQGLTTTYTADMLPGYSFQGWYSDEACTTLVSSDNPYNPTAPKYTTEDASATSLTLYAKGKKSDAATGIYLKQNGAYKQAQTAYKKVNGVWVEQTDIAALKTELQNGRYKYGG